jgi:hypothetical protein
MQWEIGHYTHDPKYFSAEAVNDETDGEGEILVTVHLSLRSEERAKNSRIDKTRYWSNANGSEKLSAFTALTS